MLFDPVFISMNHTFNSNRGVTCLQCGNHLFSGSISVPYDRLYGKIKLFCKIIITCVVRRDGHDRSDTDMAKHIIRDEYRHLFVGGGVDRSDPKQLHPRLLLSISSAVDLRFLSGECAIRYDIFHVGDERGKRINERVLG